MLHAIHLILVATLSLSSLIAADVRVAGVFGDHMVLQRDMPLPIWGWADPGTKVEVRCDAVSASATTDAQGAWRALLPALTADGKPHTLTVTAGVVITFTDVLIGEVWIGSGQSNMAAALGAGDGPERLQPELRLMTLPVVLAKTPEPDTKAAWAVADAVSSSRFSAVLWHFGRRLQRDLHVFIGLICSAKGSTNISLFLPEGGVFYNGSIVPLLPLAMRGMLWYQGEANVMAGDGLAYGDHLRTLIGGWRAAWGREFPFYIAQLAPLRTYKPDLLPPVWEAQTACLKLPRTGMAVATDLDTRQLGNIHPHSKDKVGERLALWALAKDYGRSEVVYSGPLYRSMNVTGRTLRVEFAHAQGLTTRDGMPPGDFEIAGADGVYVAATAVIEHDGVLLSADRVVQPIMARFAWRNDATPNLVNGAGLIASAFHTDHWTGGTAE
ncbi:MAG TPA: sialate O-acetylesterase [Planctomycetota bacterium]|nr:sialate O-acetylesterase [Planctomycetota bacterium]